MLRSIAAESRDDALLSWSIEATSRDTMAMLRGFASSSLSIGANSRVVEAMSRNDGSTPRDEGSMPWGL